MESIQTQLRPPGSLPITVNVPAYLEIEHRQTRIKELSRKERELGDQVEKLERELADVCGKTARSHTQATLERRAELQRAAARASTEYEEVKMRRARLADETAQLVHDYAWRIYRTQACRMELIEVGDRQGQTLRTFVPGQRQLRSRREILTELSENLTWLSRWADAAEVAEELKTVQLELAEAYQS